MSKNMKQRLRLFKKGKNAIFFVEDTETKKQTSLRTRDREEAKRLFSARVESLHQCAGVNLHLARTLALAADPAFAKRTWLEVFNALTATKTGSTRHRWETAKKDKALQLLFNKPLLETRAEHFLDVLARGTVSTNKHLRQLHNFALDLGWLLTRVLPRNRWPKQVFKDKRGITASEHLQIISREPNPERRAYYQLLWTTGGSQTDIANLTAEDVDWNAKDEEGNRITVITYFRRKLRNKNTKPSVVTVDPSIEPELRARPSSGPLFPYLRTVRECDRATEFKQRCAGLGIRGVTLHSYRYSWAERAKSEGVPERIAQEALGHASKAFARHYARGATVRVPSLELLKKKREGNVVRVDFDKQQQHSAPAVAVNS